jgi:two-component system response regulator VicR
MKRILVVDDDKLMSRALKKMLEKKNFYVDVCLEGRSAAEKINNTHYDIIITDLLMPYMTGYELMSYMFSIGKETIPVIVISAINQENAELEAFRLGAKDYMKKPIIFSALVKKMNEILSENLSRKKDIRKPKKQK